MKKILIIIIACVAMISCSKESQLDRTIFIPDQDNSSLPAYTEWGYNNFGAEWERTYFLASQDIIPCKVMFRNDSLHLLLSGIYGKTYPRQTMSLTFVFPSEKLAKYDDLLNLHKKTLNLNNNCLVKMQINKAAEQTLNIVSGEFVFKRAQLLKVDDVENRVILSGTFDFQFLGASDFPESFSDGRFDFGITAKEFYSY
ncbi:MAG: hypothetical protein LBN23_07045 [Paludibacter sp.]|jgi:hypothetical protein|nr:hypothetical protein [Paludibacter sp.]